MRIDRRIAAVAAEDLLPGVRPGGVGATRGAVVLRAAEVGGAVGVDGAAVELRHRVAVVQVLPDHRGIRRVAGRQRVEGAEDAAVVADVEGAVGRPVVARVEDQDVLVGVGVARRVAARVLPPPVGGEPPGAAAVVGAEEVDAAQPDPVRVAGVDGDGLVIPPLVEEEVGVAEAALLEGGDHRVAEQQGVERPGVGVAHLRRPRLGAAAGRRAEDREQPLVAVVVRVDRGDGVDHVLVRRRDRQGGASHRPLGEHPQPGPGGLGRGAPVDGRLLEGAAGGEDPVGPLVGADGEVEAAAEDRRRQHLRPGGAAVERAPDAGVGGRVDAPAVPGADHDVVDVAEAGGRGEAGPGGAAVGRLEDAGAAHGVDVEVALAGAGVEDARIRRVHRQGVDRDVGEQVGERAPGDAGVGRLPDAARHPRGVEGARLARVDDQRAGAAADVARAERRPAAQVGLFADRLEAALGARRQHGAPGDRVLRHEAHRLERLEVALDRDLALAGRGPLQAVELEGFGGLVMGPEPLAERAVPPRGHGRSRRPERRQRGGPHYEEDH